MSTPALLAAMLGAMLSGCVLGSGPCLLQEPLKATLKGEVHFRSYPSGDGIDHVPILTLDRTAYVYAPSLSHQCVSATELQLVGWSELPPDIPEGTHVEVEGSLFQAASMHQHTTFLINVRTILPQRTLPADRSPSAPPPPMPAAH
jgi:hypothetical protein